MRTRKEIIDSFQPLLKKIFERLATKQHKEDAVVEQIAYSQLTLEVLLDIREILANPVKEIDGEMEKLKDLFTNPPK